MDDSYDDEYTDVNKQLIVDLTTVGKIIEQSIFSPQARASKDSFFGAFIATLLLELSRMFIDASIR